MEPKLLYSHLGKRVYIVSRYQDKGNGVIVAQRKHDVTHQFDQVVREIQAYRQFPQGCQCTETDCGGDCEWCREYYGGESIIEAEPATSTADRG